MILIKDLCKSFGNQLIFKNVDFCINKCGLYGIVGSSGSGKSTLLNIIFKNEAFNSGEVIVDGTMAMIYQNYELIDELNVLSNITLYRKNLYNLKSIINDLGLKPMLHHYPKELSGGQAQRVGIARALVCNPDIILCDEPCESLDIDNKIIVMDMLKKLSQDKIVIMVSHDRQIIDEYCDVIYTIENYNIKEDIRNNNLEMFIPKNMPLVKVDAKRIVRKTLQKKNIIFSICISLMMVILGILNIISKDYFALNESRDVLNINMLYVDADASYLLEENGIALALRPIISFEEMRYNDKNYAINIIPYIDNDLYPMPAANILYINNYLADMVNLTEGSQVILNYKSVNGIFEEMNYSVGKIIHEDCTIPQAYYNIDVILDEYDNIPINDEGATFLDYFNSQATRYQVNVGYDNIENNYRKYGDIAGIDFYNLVYDERIDNYTKQRPIKLMFDIASYCIYGIIVLIAILFNYRTNNKQLRCYGLLVNFGNEIKDIKKEHLKYKIISFSLIYLILNVWLFISLNILVIIEIILLLLVYIFTCQLGMKKFSNDKINIILKTSD